MRAALISLIGLLAVVYGQATPNKTETVDEYVLKQAPAAKAGLFDNVGPSGSKAPGAKVRRKLGRYAGF